MPTRSRRPSASKTETSTQSTDTARTAAAPDRTNPDRNVDTPEVRLLGSLHPLPSREERIAIAAYWRAAKRQFEPGRELDDWLEAEREIESTESTERAAPDESRRAPPK